MTIGAVISPAMYNWLKFKKTLAKEFTVAYISAYIDIKYSTIIAMRRLYCCYSLMFSYTFTIPFLSTAAFDYTP